MELYSAVIREGTILLVKRDDVWDLPGGKRKDNESEFECLVRELKSELPELSDFAFIPYKEIKETIPGSDEKKLVKIFTASIKGDYSEVNEKVKWFYYGDLENQDISDLARKVVDLLRSENCLKK